MILLHKVVFKRYNYTIKEEEEATVFFPFTEITDTNLEDFENRIWKELYKHSKYPPKQGFSSWVEESRSAHSVAIGMWHAVNKSHIAFYETKEEAVSGRKINPELKYARINHGIQCRPDVITYGKVYVRNTPIREMS